MSATAICAACAIAIPDNQPAVRDAAGALHHLDCVPVPVLAWQARDRKLVALRLASPKRAAPGRAIADQADAGALPLFGAACQGAFL